MQCENVSNTVGSVGQGAQGVPRKPGHSHATGIARSILPCKGQMDPWSADLTGWQLHTLSHVFLTVCLQLHGSSIACLSRNQDK